MCAFGVGQHQYSKCRAEMNNAQHNGRQHIYCWHYTHSRNEIRLCVRLFENQPIRERLGLYACIYTPNPLLCARRIVSPFLGHTLCVENAITNKSPTNALLLDAFEFAQSLPHALHTALAV